MVMLFDSNIFLTSNLFVFLIVIIVSIIGYLIINFGPGHEKDLRRMEMPFSEAEKSLAKQFRHEYKYLSCPRPSRPNAEIFTRHWLPKTDPKAIIVLIHGLNDHSGRFTRTASVLLENGMAVFTLDHEGFGRSSGRHGFIMNLSYLVEDLKVYLNQIKTNFKDKRIFLLGGSMGGLIIAHVLLDKKQNIDGAILQAPAIEIHKDSRPSKTVEFFANYMLSIIPKMPLVTANRGKNNHPSISHTIEAMKEADTLFYSGRLRIGTGFSMLHGIMAIENELHNIETPILLQHGTADRVCHVSGTQYMHQTVCSKDKMIIEYKDGHHDLPNEPPEVSNAVQSDYLKWINERL